MLITFLANIVSDPNFRAAFLEDPAAAMQRAGLTDAEQALFRMRADEPGHSEALGAAIINELVVATGNSAMWPEPKLALTLLTPSSAAAGTKPTIAVVGTFFLEGISVALTQGTIRIPGVVANLVTGPQSSLDATFDLSAAAPGAYSLVATNPDKTSSSLPFTVTSGDKAV